MGVFEEDKVKSNVNMYTVMLCQSVYIEEGLASHTHTHNNSHAEGGSTATPWALIHLATIFVLNANVQSQASTGQQ